MWPGVAFGVCGVCAPSALRVRRATCALAEPEGGSAADVGGAYSVGEALKGSPAMNSTLMNAMRDYFGDDGREVQDYMKRPRNAADAPMFRVVVIGSGVNEIEMARRLHESGVISGLYYCADEGEEGNEEMEKYACSTGVSARDNEEQVVRFATWAVADAVFVGPDREGWIGKESETALASAGITLFPHDVSAAIGNGTLDVSQCLATLAEDLEEPAAEQLLE